MQCMEWEGKLEWLPYLHHGWTHLGSRSAILEAIDSEDRGVKNEELGLSDLSTLARHGLIFFLF